MDSPNAFGNNLFHPSILLRFCDFNGRVLFSDYLSFHLIPRGLQRKYRLIHFFTGLSIVLESSSYSDSPIRY